MLILSICMHNDHRYCTFKQAVEAGYKIKKTGAELLLFFCLGIMRLP